MREVALTALVLIQPECRSSRLLAYQNHDPLEPGVFGFGQGLPVVLHAANVQGNGSPAAVPDRVTLDAELSQVTLEYLPPVTTIGRAAPVAVHFHETHATVR